MEEPTSGTGMIIALVGIAFVVAVQWRQRWPVALTLVGIVVVFVAQLGPTFALIAFMWVVITSPRREALGLGLAVTAATGVAVWRDAVGTPSATSFWGTLFAQDGGPVDGYVAVVLTAVLVGAFVGIALWLRTRAELRSVEVVVASERDAVTSLTDQVSRQAEREKLAERSMTGSGTISIRRFTPGRSRRWPGGRSRVG